MLEVEQATANVEAQSRLSELRAELGLDGGATPRRPTAPRPPPSADPQARRPAEAARRPH